MKPSDAYIGVVDLFAIILPGAILTAFLAGATPILDDLAAVDTLPELTGTIGWVAFFFAAYTIGHFVFMVASQLDVIYEVYRKRRLADKEGNAYQTTSALQKEYLGGLGAGKPMETFSWALAMLDLNKPEVMSSVKRFVADSKFFRSFVVVLFVLGVGFLLKGLWLYGVLCILLMLPAFARYAERRYKSNEWAYRYVITLLASGKTENDSMKHAQYAILKLLADDGK